MVLSQTHPSGGCFECDHAFVEVQAAEGGADAKEFADRLASALLKFAALRGGNPELLSADEGYASFVVHTVSVVRRFGSEVGLHCIQRVPETEKNGRRHTSFARVTITPLSKRDSRPLLPQEIEIICQRGHGKGGQNQNKVSTAVRARHVPSGISVFVNGRSQIANRDRAMQILAERVNSVREKAAGAEWASIKASQCAPLAKIRTYNFIDNRAVDHRSGRKVYDVRSVLSGRLDLLE